MIDITVPSLMSQIALRDKMVVKRDEAIQRVRELHPQTIHESHHECEDFEAENPDFKCTEDAKCAGYETWSTCEHCQQEWPCDTRKALDNEQDG